MVAKGFASAEERDQTISRIDRLSVYRPSGYSRPGRELEHPVGPQYEKGEQIQQRKREKAREMPVMQLCQKLAVIMAMVMIMAVGGRAKTQERAMPILSMQHSRIGPLDVQTTVNVVPSANNMAVCVGLAGEHYRARWSCQFVTDKDATSVTITWRDVPYEDYALEAALWVAQRSSTTAPKVSQTYRRAFGVWRL